MPVFRLHSTSFTIEGAEGDTSSSIMEQAGHILYEWTKKKEIRLGHFTESTIPQSFPALEQFLERSSYSFHGQNSKPASLFDSVSRVLSDRRLAQGFLYKHGDQKNQGMVTLEALLVSTADNAVICSSSLSFEGARHPRYNTPPGYLLPLWQLGGRTYNTKSCSSRYYDFIQFGLSHVKTETIRVVDTTRLTGFLADKERHITAVLIPEQDYIEASPETKMIIRNVAERLAGSVEFFFLPDSYRKVRVHEPGMVFTRPGLQIAFTFFDWQRLERDQIRKSHELGSPPMEIGAISVADLSELWRPMPKSQPETVETIPSTAYEAEKGSDALLSAMTMLREALFELSSKMDQWMGINGGTT